MWQNFKAPLDTRPAALSLGASAVLWLAASAHHPFVRGHGASEVVLGLVQIGPSDRAFHAFAIVLALAMLYGFAVYTYFRTTNMNLAMAASVLFAAGTGAFIGAALIDGFFAPAYAVRGIGSASGAQTALAVIASASVAIQVLSKFGFIASGGAALLWGIDLFIAGIRARVAGAAVCACGIALALLTALIGPLTPQNLAAIAVCQTVWIVLIATRLWSAPE